MDSSNNESSGVVNLLSNASLLGILECPICNEIFLPPIYICLNGHSICKSCRPRMDKCGLCKAPFSDARNYALEQIVRESNHACPNSSRGCKVVQTLDLMSNHAQICEFKPPKTVIVKPKGIGLDTILTWTQYYSANLGFAMRSNTAGNGRSPMLEINEKVSLWPGDITKLEVDAIVNPSDCKLSGDGGVDSCIHRGGGLALTRDVRALGGCSIGAAKITRGHSLPAKYVIHTVGPRGENPTLLAAAYTSCLEMLLKHNLRSIAFPCISTGANGYPLTSAAHVVLLTVRKFMDENYGKVDRLIFATFLPEDFQIYESLMEQYFPIP